VFFSPRMCMVCTAWRDLRLRTEERISRYGGYLRIYSISSCGETTRGGPPAWKVGRGDEKP
jgi:hypothetical protein